jgi:hypothetical protein
MKAIDEARDSQASRARAMLDRFKSLPEWIREKQPTPENAQLWLAVVREIMKLAALTPDEERALKIALGLDEAEAAMEANSGRA